MNLATFKNVPVVTLCWVAFFILCFVVFLVLSLCSGKKDLRERRTARRGHSKQRASLQWGMGLEGPGGERPWAGAGRSFLVEFVLPSFVNSPNKQTAESSCTCLKWAKCCLGGGRGRGALGGNAGRDSPYRAPSAKGGGRGGGGGGMARIGREFQC